MTDKDQTYRFSLVGLTTVDLSARMQNTKDKIRIAESLKESAKHTDADKVTECNRLIRQYKWEIKIMKQELKSRQMTLF